ncbi:hypothetical protein [Photorhabdus khanii]|uniref:N-acetylglucosamine binding protein A domain-containing protein n=1 Tax=Photorhabdus khanii subsp. guanajuatensis TaxID=2100166 RepID=A0A4R4JTZ4_9GAMM|nr:hypothetical protein [Photorhabdus khanii]TDB58150.1 hypothetical protein C5467_10265 [Photorhabdus khanii subsp. guanajuatensis]
MTTEQNQEISPFANETDNKTALTDENSMGYTLTTLADNTLPNMAGFEREIWGTPQTGWLSPGYILADRDLAEGEVLLAYLIRQRDGHVLESISFTAKAEDRGKTQWPIAFAKAINEKGKQLKAGGWNKTGEFNADTEKSPPRLWHYSSENRAFTTAAFKNNQVQALAITGDTLKPNDILWVQVRDISTQYLYETHIFTPDPERLTLTEWSKDLCTQLNQKSQLIRAGTIDENTGLITPAVANNALWIPQCSDLAVTLMSAPWWSQTTITASRDLAEGETLHTYVLDVFSDAQPVAPFSYTPTAAAREKNSWLSDWAGKLNESPLASYVRLDSTTATPDTATLRQAGSSLRVFTSAPGLDNWVSATPPLSEWYRNPKTGMVILVRHPHSHALLHHCIFTPKTGNEAPKDKAQWAEALRQYIQKQPYLCLQADSDTANNTLTITEENADKLTLWVPRHSGLEVSIESVDWRDLYPDNYHNLSDYKDCEIDIIDTLTNDTVEHYVITTDKIPRFNKLAISPFVQITTTECQCAYSQFTVTITLAGLKESAKTKAYDVQQLADGTIKRKLLTATAVAMNIADVTKTRDGWIFDTSHPDMARFQEESKPIFKKISDEIIGVDIQKFITGLAKYNEVRALPDSLLRQAWPVYSTSTPTVDKIFNSTELQGLVKKYESLLMQVYTRSVWTDKNWFPSATNINLCLNQHHQLLRILHDQHNQGAIVLRLTPEAKAQGIQFAACTPANLWTTSVDTLRYPYPPEEEPKPPYGIKVTETAIILSKRPYSDDANVSGYFDSPDYSLFWLDLDIPDTVTPEQAITVAHIGRISAGNIWFDVQPVDITTPPAVEEYVAVSHLCEDYGNTFRSEVFDVSGQSETGVDPRTGLFHAHYPVCTLQGIDGNGPICDLTLHYSALRGNEAGLGDGWAFRFSSLENRARQLTLSKGENIEFTDDEWQQLSIGTLLKKQTCWISSNHDHSKFTLDFPSGRREILTIPNGDNEEPNDALRQKIIKLLEQIKDKSKPLPPKPENFWDWLLFGLSPILYSVAAALDWNQAVQKWRENSKAIDQEIARWKRPFRQLLPSQIISPTGGKLALTWERKRGQFLLKEVKSGEKSLFKAEYSHQQVTMDIWPDSSEAHQLTLTLSQYLLQNLTRTNNQQMVQRVHCGYSADPTLDRILTRLEEEDGSVELVRYETEGMKFPEDRPALPCVFLHTLIPGAGQENITSTYSYSTNNYLGVKAAPTWYQQWPYGYHYNDHDAPPPDYEVTLTRLAGEQITSTKRIYNKHHLQISEEVCTLGEAQKITTWNFNDIKPGDPLFGRPQTITTEFRELPSAPDDTGNTVTTTQSFSYNDNGQPIKSVTADGVITQWRYYPKTGGIGLNVAPVADDSVIALKTLILTCPAIPENTLPPLMAEFQYQLFENKVSPLQLTTYGYHTQYRNQRTILVANHIVKLSGVVVNISEDIFKTWTLSLAEGRKQALIQHQILSESPRTPKAPTSKITVWSATSVQHSYLGKDTTRLSTTLNWEDSPLAEGLVIHMTAQTEGGKSAVTTETRSRYSHRLLTVKKEGIETRRQYNAMGKVTYEAQYKLAKNKNTVDKDASPTAETRITYQITDRGLLATTAHADNYVTRTFSDGLQREVRSEIQRPGTTGTAGSDFCLLQEITYDNLGQEINHTLCDYLPGGLQRITEQGDRQNLPSGPQLWNMSRITEQGANKNTHEEIRGIGDQPQIISKTTHHMQESGAVTQTESLTSSSGASRFAMEKTFDVEGRLTTLKRGSGNTTTTVEVTYDELDRPVTFTTPDQTVITRRYHGFSNQVTELKVNNTVVGTRQVT